MFGPLAFLVFQIVIIGASFGLGALGVAASEITLRKIPMRRRWLSAAAAFLLPCATILYFDFGIIGHAWVQHKAAEDNFLDGVYRYQLPNNYELVIFDKMPGEAHLERKDYRGASVIEVKELQVSGDYLLVAHYKGKSFLDPGPYKPANDFVLVDTRDDSEQTFSTREELHKAASQYGMSLQLLSVREYLTHAEKSSHFRGWSLVFFLLPPATFWIGFLFWVSALGKKPDLPMTPAAISVS